MSTYGHQMEGEHSARSLSGDSDLGSRYIMESGLYMTSFAGTIFISGLVTLGILLLSLIVALAVMLQSCQNKKLELVVSQKLNEDYGYCKIYAMHAEPNTLESYEFPRVCRSPSLSYVKEGLYAKELDSTKSVIDDYFNGIRPLDDGLDVVLMDIDDVLSSCPHSPNLLQRSLVYDIDDCVQEAMCLKHTLILSLYLQLKATGWPIILLSAKPVRDHNITKNHLSSSGFRDWSSLIMRLDDEEPISKREYLSRERTAVQEKGFRVRGVISSHIDASSVSDLRMRIFKLPDPLCIKFDFRTRSTW